MQYMAQIKINNSEAFRDILPELTDIQIFSTYLENLPIETHQMQEKKVLRIKQPMNDSIVALATSNTAYIDDDFYKEKFGENLKDEQKKAFPVNIVSMKINWIISTQEGKDFLWAILQSERLEYYEI